MSQTQLPGGLQVNGYHDFSQQLQFSEIDNKELNRLYHSCFHEVVGVVRCEDIGLQKLGIDTLVVLESGRLLHFDEKIRKTDWGDIWLEEISVWPNYPYCNGSAVKRHEPIYFDNIPTRMKRGWLDGNKQTDYITYIVKPAGKVYFLPFLLLQKAWRNNYYYWIQEYGRKSSPNKGYRTTAITVPPEVLCKALFDAEIFYLKDNP